MPTVIIDGIEYVPKAKNEKPKIENNIGATHYAILPDDSIVFYCLGDGVLVYLPMSNIWKYIDDVPYDLIKCDES